MVLIKECLNQAVIEQIEETQKEEALLAECGGNSSLADLLTLLRDLKRPKIIPARSFRVMRQKTANQRQ